MTLNIFEILVLVSLTQGLFFSIVILTQKPFRVKANKYLAYNVFLLAYIGITELVRAKGFHKQNNVISYLIDDIPWLLLFYIPLFVYFLKSAGNKFSNSKKLIFLIIPFIIFLILFNLIILHHEYKLIYWQVIQDEYRFIYDVGYYFAILFNIVLCILSYFIIQSSTISYNEKKWLKNIWFFNVILLLIWVLDSFLPKNSLPYTNDDITYPVWFGVSFFVYWLIFRGLIQLKLSQEKSEIKGLLQSKNEQIVPKKETDRTTVNKEFSIKNEHFENFLELIVQEKLYRNPDLSRDIVADKLNMSPGYLSQLISASINSNFTTLINDYRIEDIKWMLLNPDFNKYSLVTIGLEAGFKSKSTFYSEFKKKTGYTPNQFKLMKKSPN